MTQFQGHIDRTLDASTPWWPEPADTARTPNIVTIVLDDTGWSDFGCFGSEVRTPHIDALATGGLRYTNFHVTPICSPTRAALLTGCNHHKLGMRCLADTDTGFPNSRGAIHPAIPLLPDMLRSSPRPPPTQRAPALQPRDLLAEQLVVHGHRAELRLQLRDPVVPIIPRRKFQARGPRFEKSIPPAAELRHGDPKLPRQDFQRLAAKNPEHRLLLPPCRHAPEPDRRPGRSDIGHLRAQGACVLLLCHHSPPCGSQ